MIPLLEMGKGRYLVVNGKRPVCFLSLLGFPRLPATDMIRPCIWYNPGSAMELSRIREGGHLY